MAKLGDIATIQSGGTPARSIAEYWEDGTIPWVKISDIKSKHLNQTEEMITEVGLENSSAKIFPKGTILYTIFATLGETSILEINAATNQAIAGISITDSRVLPDYLYYYLLSQKIHVQKIGRGVAQNNINMKLLRDFDVPLPSKEAQLNIIEQLNQVTELLFLRKQQLTKLDELIKARFVEMFENNTYPKVKVSTVCDFITKGTTPPNDLISEEYSSDKVPYLKVYNLSFNGELLFDTAPQYISENIHNGMLARSKVYPNDVLMNIVGPPLGKFSLVTDEFPEWNINQAIAIFRAKEKINPKYLLSALMQPEVLNPFLRQAVGIRQLNLSLSQCRDLEIFLPPLSLQNQFADFVAEVDKSKLFAGSAVAHKPFDIEFFSKSTVQRPIKEV